MSNSIRKDDQITCIDNGNYRASLTVQRRYVALADEDGGFVRVADDAGEDYLFPADLFRNDDEHDRRVRVAKTMTQTDPVWTEPEHPLELQPDQIPVLRWDADGLDRSVLRIVQDGDSPEVASVLRQKTRRIGVYLYGTLQAVVTFGPGEFGEAWDKAKELASSFALISAVAVASE